MTDGGEPSIARSCATLASTLGIDSSSPHVYGCCGLAKTSPAGAVLDRAAGVHDHHRLRRLGDDAEVVRDQDHADVEVALDLVDQLEDLRLHRHVERGRGLVGDQHVGVVDERHRDHRALPHAARELVRVVARAVARVRDADRVEHLDGALEGARPC